MTCSKSRRGDCYDSAVEKSCLPTVECEPDDHFGGGSEATHRCGWVPGLV